MNALDLFRLNSETSLRILAQMPSDREPTLADIVRAAQEIVAEDKVLRRQYYERTHAPR